jgi:hypothetical protein
MPLPPIKVFVSYVSSEEETGIEELDYTLSQLQNQVGADYRIDYWFDRYADEDRVFTKQAEEKLLAADVILLLICPEYFLSNYIIRHEKPLIEKRFRERNKKGKEVEVIALILAEFAYDRHWVFPLQLETIPRNYRYPILKGRRSWDDVWQEITHRLDTLFEESHEEFEEQAKLASYYQTQFGIRKKPLTIIKIIHPGPYIVFGILLLIVYWAMATAQLKKACPGNYVKQNNYTDTRFIGPTARCINTPCLDEKRDQ